MDTNKQRIVVGIDGSTGARAALLWAMTEAAHRGADLEAVTAFPVDFYWTDAYLLDRGRVDSIRADTEAHARAMVEEARSSPELAAVPGAADVGVAVVVCAGLAAPHLVQRAAGAALLVVGSRGRGAVRSTVAGSVALHCAAHAPCQVVVVHAPPVPATEPPRVVVGLDDSDQARAALAAAAVQAASLGARVDAVLAYEAPNYWSDLYAVLVPLGETGAQARTRGEALVRDVLGAEPGDAVRVVAVEGHPAQVLEQQAEGAALLVVGSKSRNQLPGVLLGSVALHCVIHAPCPVLVVHPQRAGKARPQARPVAAAAPAVG